MHDISGLDGRERQGLDPDREGAAGGVRGTPSHRIGKGAEKVGGRFHQTGS